MKQNANVWATVWPMVERHRNLLHRAYWAAVVAFPLFSGAFHLSDYQSWREKLALVFATFGYVAMTGWIGAAFQSTDAKPMFMRRVWAAAAVLAVVCLTLAFFGASPGAWPLEING